MRNPRYLAAAALVLVVLAAVFYMLMRQPAPEPEALPAETVDAPPAEPESPAPPVVDTKVPDPTVPEEETVETPPQALVIRGTVRDALTDAPIEGAEVYADTDIDEVFRTETDGAGAFELSVEGEWLGDVEDVAVRAEGYSVNRKALASLGEAGPGAELFAAFSLHRGTSIRGTVRDRVRGEGIAGVKIRAVDARASLFDAMWDGKDDAVESDASGAFEIPNLSAGAYRVFTDGQEAGYVPVGSRSRIVNLEDEGSQAHVEFILEKGGVIAGRVVDTQGRPVRDAMVSMMPVNIPIFQDVDSMMLFEYDASVTTDANGAFEILGAGFDYKYRVSVHPEAYAPSASEPVQVTRAQPRAEIRLVVAPGATVSGVAVYEDNTPAAGLELTLNPEMSDLMTGGVGMDSVNTDENGAFTFTHVAAGEYTILPDNFFESFRDDADAIDLLDPFSDQVSVTSDGETPVTGLSVVVQRPTEGTGVITGIVFLASGAPAANVYVDADPIGQRGSEGAMTDSDGRFSIEKLPAPVYELSVDGDSGSVVLNNVPVGSDVTLRLNPPLRVAGQVVDESGQPVPNARVRFESADESFDAGEFMTMFMADSGNTTETDDAGHFTFGNVEPGRYVFKAKSASRGSGASMPVTLAVGRAPANLVIRLEPGSAVSGVVVDGAGRALEGATVSLLETGGPDDAFSRYLPAAMQEKGGTATSDASGSFRMVNVPAGEYALTATRPGMAPARIEGITVEARRDMGNLRIAVTNGGCVEGVVRIGDDLRPGIMVQLSGESGQHMAMCDDSGRYEICAIAPGEYMAMAVDMQRAQAGDMSGASTRTRFVEIVDGTTVTLNIEPPANGVQVSGVISGSLGNMTQVFLRVDGGPTMDDFDMFDPASQVEMMRYMAGQTMARPDGSFDFGYVEPGDYVLEVISIDFSMSDLDDMQNINRTPQIRQEIEIKEGTPIFLELEL